MSAAALKTHSEPSERASPQRASAAVGTDPQLSIDLCDAGRVVVFEEEPHWVHHEEPDRLNASIGEFLGGGGGDLNRRVPAANP